MTIMRALTAVLFVATAFAQDKPAFEVASIRPGSLSIPGGSSRLNAGGTLVIINLSLKEVIVQAWNVRPFQVLGGPPWVDSARYNVSAKPETKVQHAEIMRMLQSLLADRFQLTMHRETRELPLYALVLAKKDGKLGPGIVEPKGVACSPSRTSAASS
jgi:uncharacterized protein (TIGR03435 family)